MNIENYLEKNENDTYFISDLEYLKDVLSDKKIHDELKSFCSSKKIVLSLPLFPLKNVELDNFYYMNELEVASALMNLKDYLNLAKKRIGNTYGKDTNKYLDWLKNRFTIERQRAEKLR